MGLAGTVNKTESILASIGHGKWFNVRHWTESVLFVFSFPHHRQWNLVCERSFLPELSMMIFGIGRVIGESVGNIVSDKLGRKWVALTGFVIILISGSLSAVSHNYEMFVALIFIGAVANAVCYLHLDKKFRSYTNYAAFVYLLLRCCWVIFTGLRCKW